MTTSTPNSNDRWRLDSQFEDKRLKVVTREGKGYVITSEDGWSLGLPDVDWQPEVGDTARYFGDGIGRPVRGVVVFPKRGGAPLVAYYRTVEEQQAEDDRRLGEWRAEQQTTAAREHDANDARIAALPPEFQQRIARFRTGNPEFEWEHQPYELFTCEEAVKIATAVKMLGMTAQDFGKLDWQEQKKLVPAIDDGHSGNTFGMAVRLAHWYLTQPANVAREHGALTPLVGCKSYGCMHDGDGESVLAK